MIYGTSLGTLYLKEDNRERQLSLLTLTVEFMRNHSLKIFVVVGIAVAGSVHNAMGWMFVVLTLLFGTIFVVLATYWCMCSGCSIYYYVEEADNLIDDKQ